MPADVIEQVAATLAKNSPVGLNFTNMRNKAYGDNNDSDSDNDSDNDSDYKSDDESNRGVDRHSAGPPNPPDANTNENHKNEEDDDDRDNEDDAPPDNDEFPENDADEDETPVLPENDTNEDKTLVLTVELKKVTDSNGALPPILKSRMRQTAQGTNETLVTTEEEKEEWTKPVSKKQRKIQRELQKQMLKRIEKQNKRKLRNKVKNEKRRIKIKERKKDKKAKEEPDEFGDLRDQLRTKQKPGVPFPHDSCSSKVLTPKLEAIAPTQYNLKRRLKEFGNDGLIAVGKEVKQLYTRKVSKPVDRKDLTKDQKGASLPYLMFLTKKLSSVVN
jgi:hypothetical protein